MMTFTDEQVDSAFGRTPQIVQDFMLEDYFSDTVLDIAKKYQLHVDVSEQFRVTVRNMLIGLIDPKKFSEELRSFGLVEDVISNITRDINEKIFKPLREAEQDPEALVALRKPSPVPAQPVAPPAVQTLRPVTPPPAPPPRPISAPAAPQQPRPQALQPITQQQAPAPVRPAVSVPSEPKPAAPVFAPFKKPVTSTPPASIQKQPNPVAPPIQKPPVTPPTSVAPIVSAQEDTAPARPAIRTMMRDADEVQHPAPVVEKPAAPQPVATPPRMATAPITTPSFNKTSTTPTPNAQELGDTLRKYGIDPYREPVE